jgi:hypothetical protein
MSLEMNGEVRANHPAAQCGLARIETARAKLATNVTGPSFSIPD